MVTLGTVYTLAIGEPVTLDDVASVLEAHGVEGATLIPAVGYWQGKRERSVVVTLAGIPERTVRRIAESICQQFNQDAVYVSANARAYLVSAPAVAAA